MKRNAGKLLAVAVIVMSLIGSGLGGDADARKRKKNVKHYVATVEVGCAVNSNTRGITASQDANNQCLVTFPRNIQPCTIVAAPFLNGFPVLVGGEVMYQKQGAQVLVRRFDSSGGTPTAGLFSIAAHCPPN